jgi:GTP-binding protein
VAHKDFRPFVMADVPGLIPGAAEGKGLGHDFLRHVERTRVLIHLIDGARPLEEMRADYESILSEMEKYQPEMLERPRLTVLSKADLAEGDAALGKDREKFIKELKKRGECVLSISSAARRGISDMLDEVVKRLDQLDQVSETMDTFFPGE